MDNPSLLQDYYTVYLRNVRQLSESSIVHYLDALRWISRFLQKKGLLRNSIFEVVNLAQLQTLKNILFTDHEFEELNSRGHQMYSAGMNNYLRFAEAQDFVGGKPKLILLDKPMPVPEETYSNGNTWKRSALIRDQVLETAEYQCEIDPSHKTFVLNHSDHQYAEGHHIIALNQQKNFTNSIDIYANIICLCPICHRLLHYGSANEKRPVAKMLYHQRADRLAKSGIRLSQSEFEQFVI